LEILASEAFAESTNKVEIFAVSEKRVDIFALEEFEITRFIEFK
jgi:hypothetical protein